MSMSFTQFAEAHGLIVSSIIEGKWVRTRTIDKPTHRNGAYKYLGDIGFVQNHATMEEVAIWRSDRPMDPAQKARQERDLQALRRQEAKKRAEAIRAMRAYWRSLPPLIGEHPYLVRKQLTMMGCAGLKRDGDLLAIPVHKGGELISLQTIAPDGAKKYRYGCPIKGGSYVLRRPNATLTCLVEGFATGLAIYQSLPMSSVIVCFDAGNMGAVAQDLRVSGLCVVCADNDWQKERKMGRNTGVECGIAVAQAIGSGIAYPEGIFGTDWADALIEWKEQGPGRLRMEILKGAKFVQKR